MSGMSKLGVGLVPAPSGHVIGTAGRSASALTAEKQMRCCRRPGTPIQVISNATRLRAFHDLCLAFGPHFDQATPRPFSATAVRARVKIVLGATTAMRPVRAALIANFTNGFAR